MKYQVFTQSAADQPHMHCGSVHAADAEMALLLGRDVYTRRPHCVSLWVVPQEAILSFTQEQLQAWQPAAAAPDAPQQAYHVFCKPKPAGALTWQRLCPAASAELALAAALQAWEEQPQPALWWVFPAEAVTSTRPEEAAALFAPAENKPFRQSAYYRVVSQMRRLRRERKSDA